MARMSNTAKATTVGASVGAIAAPIIAYGAQVLQAKTGVPAEVTMPALGALAGFFMRWAAKLDPSK
jgi:hypothetical protein